MANNLPSAEEIARVRARVAGRPKAWKEYLPADDEIPQAEDFPDRPTPKTNIVPKNMNSVIYDAKRLYNVCEAIYKTLITFNYITGILGALAGVIFFIAAAITHETMAGLAGIAVCIGTIIFCLLNYAVAVLTTHFGKVLSNISITLSSK